MFIGHTPELRRYPVGGSFVAAVEAAVSRAGGCVVDMAPFAARDRESAAGCREAVASADVHLLVAGFRYGSPVRDRPGVSCAELEFEVASELGLPRLAFLVDEEAEGPGALFRDLEFGARQEAFRRRLAGSGVVVGSVRTPAELGVAVERALTDLPASDAGSAEGAVDEALLERLPPDAKALKDKLYSLRELDSAIREQIVGGNHAAAQQFTGIARRHALSALEMALECAALPPDSRRHFSADAIGHAEQLLGIEPGAFSSFFHVNLDPGAQERKKALRELLVEVHERISGAPVVQEPRTPPSWLPVVLRIGSAVLVATAVGAPLGALAVGESVVKEIVKAGIAVTTAVMAVEATNHALERWLKPPSPVEPVASGGPHGQPWKPHHGVARGPSAPVAPAPLPLASAPEEAPVPPPEHDPAAQPFLDPAAQDPQAPISGPAGDDPADEPFLDPAAQDLGSPISELTEHDPVEEPLADPVAQDLEPPNSDPVVLIDHVETPHRRIDVPITDPFDPFDPFDAPFRGPGF